MGGIFEQLSGAKGLRSQGKSAENIANFNAAVLEQQATAAKTKAGFASKRQAKKAAEIKSSQIVNLSTGLSSPVAGDLIAAQAEELELENLLIGFEGEVESQRLRSAATLSRLQGKAAKQAGKSAARGANIQFGVQLASLAFLAGFGGGGAGAGGGGSIGGTSASGGSGVQGLVPR